MKYLFSLLLMIITVPAMASEPLKVTYALYASGFNVVDMQGTYTITDNTYDLIMDLETTGMLGRLAPWSGVIQSSGLNKGVNSSPLKHSFASTWRDDTETNIFEFDQSGALKSYIKKDSDGTTKDKMPDDEVLAGKPTDMLSALFRAMQGDGCTSTHPALDGKRRFDMAFRSKGTDVLQQSKYSIFEGEAEICEVEIIPVAGKWRDKPRGWMSIQQQAKGKGQLPRIWFGKVRDDLPPIPVRFLIKTDYGAMVMHLKDVQG